MQAIAPVGDHNPNDHTESEIVAALHYPDGVRHMTFRYELLDRFGVVKNGELPGVESCTIEQNWLSTIKRTATFKIRDAGEIDWLSDRIRPYVQLRIPPYGDRDFAEWPQGTFLLSSPTQSSSASGVVTRSVAAYDLLQRHHVYRPVSRTPVTTGTDLVSAAYSMLGLTFPPPLSFPKPFAPIVKDWEPGTPLLTRVNELLSMAGYNSLAYDELGREVITPYVLPADRADEYEYRDDAYGVMVPAMEKEQDLFSVPNQWYITVSVPDRPMLTASYTNNNPASPTSTVRRAMTITDFRTESDAATQAVLNAKVARLAFEASQVYESIDFQTALMPIHSGNDVYRIRYAPLGINSRYVEQSWTMTLRAGAPMRHRVRRVVPV